MVSFIFMISPILLVSSIMSNPLPTESSHKLPTTTEHNFLQAETEFTTTEIVQTKKSKQFLITPLEDSILLTPIRQKQEFVEEEHPDSMVEVIGEPGEMLQPSDNIIFRPLFTYRTLQEQKRRRILNRESQTKKSSTGSPEENAIKRRSSAYVPQVEPQVQPYPQVLPYYTVPFYYYNGGYYYPNL